MNVSRSSQIGLRIALSELQFFPSQQTRLRYSSLTLNSLKGLGWLLRSFNLALSGIFPFSIVIYANCTGYQKNLIKILDQMIGYRS